MNIFNKKTIPTSTEQADRPPHTKRFPTLKRWAIIVASGLVLAAITLGIGTTLPDPTKSMQYGNLNAQLMKSEAHVKTMQAGIDERNAAFDKREKDITAAETKSADGIKQRESTSAASLKAREDAVAKSEADVKARETAVAGAEAQKAANTITAGTWTVGKDVEAGTYRTTAAVSSGCYWEITVTGSNGGDIVENDLPSGGYPTVILSPGQTFDSNRCGSWLKQ